MIRFIKDEDSILSIIIKSSYNEYGIHFFTPDDFSQQLGYMRHKKDHVIAPHLHNKHNRNIELTNEVLFIKKGKLQVDFYRQDMSFFCSEILETGDVILLAKGGHGFKVLEEVEMIEVKQGPFVGDSDKTRF